MDTTTGWQVEVFFDGECPLCLREINMLRRLDRKARIRFTDITAPGFDPETIGLDMDSLMTRIHARLPEGTFIEGVEVFRRLYGAVGFGWAVKTTRLPGVSGALDAAYEIFAKNRLKWTGRCEADTCAIPDTQSARA